MIYDSPIQPIIEFSHSLSLEASGGSVFRMMTGAAMLD